MTELRPLEVQAVSGALPTGAASTTATRHAAGGRTVDTTIDVEPGARVREQVTVRLQRGGRSLDAELVTFRGLTDEGEHLALRLGPRDGTPVVRVHSECLTGDLFGSLRCDCGPQLDEALGLIAERGGVLLYLRQEGRGIGLYGKLDAYRLQDEGMDTFAANRALGFPDDARDYAVAAQMLTALGIGEIDLVTGNPDKVAQLRFLGVTIREVLPTGRHLTECNAAYLSAKIAVGHCYAPQDDEVPPPDGTF